MQIEDEQGSYECLKVRYYKSPEDDNLTDTGEVQDKMRCSQRTWEDVDTRQEVVKPFIEEGRGESTEHDRWDK